MISAFSTTSLGKYATSPVIQLCCRMLPCRKSQPCSAWDAPSELVAVVCDSRTLRANKATKPTTQAMAIRQRRAVSHSQHDLAAPPARRSDPRPRPGLLESPLTVTDGPLETDMAVISSGSGMPNRLIPAARGMAATSRGDDP